MKQSTKDKIIIAVIIAVIFAFIFGIGIVAVIKLEKIASREPNCQQVGWYEVCVERGGILCLDIYPKCEE